VIAIQHLPPGTRVRLKSGAVVEVVDNPRDGTWMLVRPAAAPAKPTAPGEDVLCNADEVEAVLDDGPGPR
jgi:hypothetical protein